MLNDQPALALVMLIACPMAYGLMGALIHWRQLPSIVVTLGASFVWLGLALMVLPLPGGRVPAVLTGFVRLHPPFAPMPIVLAVIPMVIAHLILNKMSYGVVLRAVAWLRSSAPVVPP
jgi:ribose transport system permease protein